MKRRIKIQELPEPKRVKLEENTHPVIPCMKNMPTELLVNMFDHLDWLDRLKIGQVCYRWFGIAEEFYGKKYCLRIDSNTNLSQSGSLYKTFSRSLRMKDIKNVHIDMANLTLNRDLNPCFKVIGRTVKHLSILDKDYLFYDDEEKRIDWNAFFQNFPALETLTISNFFWLKNVDLPCSLHKIRVSDFCVEIDDIAKLDAILKRNPGVKTFNSERILLDKENLEQFGKKFLQEPLQDVLKTLNHNAPYFVIKSDLNLAANKLILLEAVKGLEFTSCIPALDYLKDFESLNELHLCFDDELSAVANLIVNAKLPQVQILKLEGERMLTKFSSIVNSFPNLEKLEISQCNLRNAHLAIICEKFPRLKSLRLLNYWNNILTLEPFMDVDPSKYSLKNLKHLEELHIETNIYRTREYRQQQTNCIKEWPALPKLKKLELRGYCFNRLKHEHFVQIGTRCPNVTSFTIDLEEGLRDQFFPLLQQWENKLKTFKVLGAGLDLEWYQAHSQLILEHIYEYGQQLQYISIRNTATCFNLSDQYSLFQNIPTLKWIKTSKNEYDKDVAFTRDNYRNIKNYLSENLKKYFSDLDGVVNFIFNTLMTRRERLDYFKLPCVKELSDNEKAQKVYIIFKYLKMSRSKICKFITTLCDQEVSDTEVDTDEE